MAEALAGVRVLDLSRLVAGGMLGMVLADFGAEVVKVEQPGHGDPLRAWTVQGESLWWRVYGRNKRAVTLNLQAPEGQEIFRRLIPRFDVLIEAFVPGTMERWGLDWETLRQWHPGLILARISGWGQTGPDAARPGFGTLVEAASGFAAMNGEPDGAPIVPAYPLADMTTALYGYGAIMTALYHREVHNGAGQMIDLSLFESIFSTLGPLAAEYAQHGVVRGRQGSRSRNAGPRGVYKTADGAWIAVSASTPTMAERFMRAYDLGEMLGDPRFATNEARVHHGEELDAAVTEAIGSRTLAENRAIIARHQLTAQPVQTIAAITDDPHWRARDLLVDAEDDAGSVRMHHVVPRLSETPGAIRWPGRPVGADNYALYGDELGIPDDALARLTERGVI